MDLKCRIVILYIRLLMDLLFVALLSTEVLYCLRAIWELGGPPLLLTGQPLPIDLMVVRRLYATEMWVALGALAIYWAIRSKNWGIE